MNKKRLLQNILYPIFALLLFISVWAIIAYCENKPLVLPQIDIVFNSLFALIAKQSTWKAIAGTLIDTISAFSLSFVIALILSIISTIYPTLHKIISPINTILRATPTMAIILLSVLWLNYDKVPLFIGFLIAFPLLYSLFRESFISVDKNLLEMAKVFNVSKKDKLTNIYLPSVLPNIFANSATVISLTTKVVIAAEVLAYVSNTIGNEMQMASNMIESDILLAYTILAILLSFTLELVFTILKKLAEVKYGYKH